MLACRVAGANRGGVAAEVVGTVAEFFGVTVLVVIVGDSTGRRGGIWKYAWEMVRVLSSTSERKDSGL